MDLNTIMTHRAHMASLMGFKMHKEETLPEAFARLEVLVIACFVNVALMTTSDEALVLGIMVSAVARHQRTSPEKIFTKGQNYYRFKRDILQSVAPASNYPDETEHILSGYAPTVDRRKTINAINDEYERTARKTLDVEIETLRVKRERYEQEALALLQTRTYSVKDLQINLDRSTADLYKKDRNMGFCTNAIKQIPWLLRNKKTCVVFSDMLVPVGDLEEPCAENLRALLSGHEEALHLSVDEVDSLCFNPDGPHSDPNFDLDRFVHSMKMFSESFKQLASVQVSGATGKSVPPVSDGDECPEDNGSLGLKQNAGGKVTGGDKLVRPCRPMPYRARKKGCQTRRGKNDNKSELAAVTTESTIANESARTAEPVVPAEAVEAVEVTEAADVPDIGRSPPVSDGDEYPKDNGRLGLKQSAGGKVTGGDKLMRPCRPMPYRARTKGCQTRLGKDDNKSELAAVTTKSTIAKESARTTEPVVPAEAVEVNKTAVAVEVTEAADVSDFGGSPPVSDGDGCPKDNGSLDLKQSAGGKVTGGDKLVRPCRPMPYRARKKGCQIYREKDDNKSELCAVATKSAIAKVGFSGKHAD